MIRGVVRPTDWPDHPEAEDGSTKQPWTETQVERFTAMKQMKQLKNLRQLSNLKPEVKCKPELIKKSRWQLTIIDYFRIFI